MDTTISKSFMVGLVSLAIACIVTMSVLAHAWIPLLLFASGIGFVLFTVIEPFKGILVWLLLYPYLRSYIQIPLPSGIPDLTFERVFIVCILLALIVQVILKTRQLVPIGMIEKVMILFITVGFVSTIFRSDDIGKELLIIFDENAIPFLLFAAAKNLFSSHDEVRKLNYVLVLLGLGLAFHGIYQYVTHATLAVGYVDEAQLAKFEGSHLLEHRAVGPFVLGQAYGGTLAIIFIWTLYLALFDSQEFKRFFLVIALGLMGLGVFLSLTRSVWLAFFVSLFIIQIFNQKLRKLFILSIAGLTIVFLVTWLILPERPQFMQRAAQVGTIYQRLANYRAALWMSLAKPVFGYGPSKETFLPARLDYLSGIGSITAEEARVASIHNQYLNILLRYGLLGLIPYMAIFFLMIKSGLSLTRLLPDKQSSQYQFVIFFCGTLAAYLLQGLFADVAALTFLSSLFYISAGVLEGLRFRELSCQT